ncbi:hypothetical protein BDQ17DRAFT_477939 [Cyathus striatus]|nr:hypothetical protein BDQ17DRAFT_477939 [Cyathus striatus]
MPYLFTTDYSDTIKANLASPYNPISFLPQLGIMALACWWSYKCVGWTIFLATMSYDTEVAYVSGGAACIGAGVFVVLVMTISRLRLGRFIESASLLWHYTGFFFRIFGFYVFMISHLAAFVITYIPAALALMGVHGVLGTIVVMIGVEISFFSLWWLCKALMKELWVLAKTVVRPLWRVFAGRLVRRRRTGSMGV